MKTFITLLREINVSGKNIIRLAELEQALTNAGFQKVRTYIQSGNIIFDYEEAQPYLVSKLV
ncbi:MAG: DUF1697 domain-containing protein [Lentimicrobium sp.]|nr:DUF1697 domain-containing protein [Lentimicrobium sp.]